MRHVRDTNCKKCGTKYAKAEYNLYQGVVTVNYTCPNCGDYSEKQEILIPSKYKKLFTFAAQLNDGFGSFVEVTVASHGSSLGFLFPNETFDTYEFYRLNYMFFYSVLYVDCGFKLGTPSPHFSVNEYSVGCGYMIFEPHVEQQLSVYEAFRMRELVNKPGATQSLTKDYIDVLNHYIHSINSRYGIMPSNSDIKRKLDYQAEQLSGKTSGCYIATCVYGSYDCPEVWTLRRFRDYSLARSFLGRSFIAAYYKTSPTLVRLWGNKSWFKSLFRALLNRLVLKLQKRGYADSPYSD